MKFLLVISLSLYSFICVGQYPERVDLDKIIQEIVIPIEKGAIDQVSARIIFPLTVGESTYTAKTFHSNFSKIFIDGYTECLSDPDNYQVALPGEDNWCLAVCMTAPDEYAASVLSFVKQNGMWMLKGIDLQD